MPARALQGVTSVPVDEWTAFCLECCWVGTPTDETGCVREAYDHNQAKHDGAGVEPQLSDFFEPVEDRVKFYRRLLLQSLAAALVSLLVATWTAMSVDDPILRALSFGLNFGAGGANCFSAGKWACRMEDARHRLGGIG